MINYEAQNYKLFVDYALILLKFTLAGDKSFLKSFAPSPSEEKRNKEEDAEDPETDTRTLGFFGLAVFQPGMQLFVLFFVLINQRLQAVAGGVDKQGVVQEADFSGCLPAFLHKSGTGRQFLQPAGRDR